MSEEELDRRRGVGTTTGVMYLAHFGLREAPFTITPDPRYLYMSERHREALAHLLYGVGEGGGFVQLTGEVGTGKTTLCRCLLEQVPPRVDVALILNPRVTSIELLATVCDELRIAYPAGTASLKTLVDALYRHLLDSHARGRRVVVIIDEAQDLSAEVLEQVRLLTNLETAREKLMQITLIGQPELVAMLDREDLRQLAQRITARYHLEPFSQEETLAYIRHRLQVAGRTRGIFSDVAVRKVHAASGGIPRLINVICDRALLGAYAHQKSHVDARMVAKAAAEVRGPSRRWRMIRSWKWAPVAGVVGLAIAGGAVVLFAQLSSWPPARVSGPDAAMATANGAAPKPVTARVEQVAAVEAPAVPVPAAAATPKLAAILADPNVRSDEGTAFAAVFRRWGLDPADAKGELGCEAARAEGLRCLFRTGTWTRLRRYNLPAILELTGPGGTRHYVAATGLHGGTVTVDIGGRQLTLPQAELDPLWDGLFTLVWKPPAIRNVPLVLGMRGKEVEWLRARLSALDGQPVSAKRPEVFDGELRDRVLDFQRSRSLDPDGLVGDETILHLTLAMPEAGSPVLSAAGR